MNPKSAELLCDVCSRLAGRVVSRLHEVERTETAVVFSAVAEGLGPIMIKHNKGGAERQVTERVALKWLNSVDCAARPRLLAAGTSLFLLEHLGERTPNPEEWEAVAEALGGVHAVGRQGVEVLHATAGERYWVDAQRRELVSLGPSVVASLEALGLEESRLPQAFVQLGERLSRSDLFFTLTHGDVDPANVLMTKRGPVFIDWERAGVRSAAYDLASMLLVLPTDPSTHGALVDAWRRGVGPAVPHGRVFDRELADQTAWRTLQLLAYLTLPSLEGSVELEGGGSSRGVLLRATSIADRLWRRARRGGAFGRVWSGVHAELTKRWPDEPLPSW